EVRTPSLLLLPGETHPHPRTGPATALLQEWLALWDRPDPAPLQQELHYVSGAGRLPHLPKNRVCRVFRSTPGMHQKYTWRPGSAQNVISIHYSKYSERAPDFEFHGDSGHVRNVV